MTPVTRWPLLLTMVVVFAALGGAHAQSPPGSAIEQRERASIQAVLDGLLSAEKAKNRELVRRYVTRGTLWAWDRDAREDNVAELRTALGLDIERIEITWLAIDEEARSAQAAIKGFPRTLDLRREDGAWKVDGEMEDRIALQELADLMFKRRRRPVPPAPTLAGMTLSDADLPSGWKLERDEILAGNIARLSYVSEVTVLRFTRQGGGTLGQIEYRLFSGPEQSTWYLWRAAQSSKAHVYDAEGESTKRLSDAVVVSVSDGSASTQFFRKGRVFVTLTLWRSAVPAASITADKLGRKALSRLK